jgi:hypothetical protein
MKKDHRGINLASKPSGDECVECLQSSKGWWFHLRRCAECGHIGCCDSSRGRHASKHAVATGHPIITSFEPGEDWFFDYEKPGMIEGVELFPPHSHPEDQSSPGPAGRVPANCCTSLVYLKFLCHRPDMRLSAASFKIWLGNAADSRMSEAKRTRNFGNSTLLGCLGHIVTTLLRSRLGIKWT